MPLVFTVPLDSAFGVHHALAHTPGQGEDEKVPDGERAGERVGGIAHRGGEPFPCLWCSPSPYSHQAMPVALTRPCLYYTPCPCSHQAMPVARALAVELTVLVSPCSHQAMPLVFAMPLLTPGHAFAVHRALASFSVRHLAFAFIYFDSVKLCVVVIQVIRVPFF